MGKDSMSANVEIAENSGIYLVVVPDSPAGSPKPAPGIILPGQSSNMRYESIDALAAYSIKDGRPVDLKLISMDGSKGPSAHWWKYPDGCHGTVRFQDGEAVLDMDVNVPYFGPTPSSQRAWGIVNVPKPEFLSQHQQDLMNGALVEFLKQHHGPAEVERVMNAVNEKVAAYQVQAEAADREV